MGELINKINMWKRELERQDASMGIMTVFDSICTYLGDQYRLTEQQKELLRRYENGEQLYITYPKNNGLSYVRRNKPGIKNNDVKMKHKKIGMKHLEDEN